MPVLFLYLSFLASVFSKANYFQVIAGKDEKAISQMITTLESSKQDNEHKAYLGALKMKRSELLKSNKEKLEVFKEGKSLLEHAISGEPKNVEFRFLRLMIQENVPKVLKYSDKVKEDAEFVKTNYKSLSPELRKVVTNYAGSSAALNL